MRKERAIKGKMLRKAGVGAVVFSAALTLSGCHSHEWTEADCISPQTCMECGETEGEAWAPGFVGRLYYCRREYCDGTEERGFSVQQLV